MTTLDERHDAIRRRLLAAMRAGHLEEWTDYSSGNGTRWVVWGDGWEREFTTSEIEAYLDEAEKEVP